VIPIRERAKRPAVAWKAYQNKYVSEKTLHEWFRRSPDFNVGIVTGALSGLVVLDVDPRHGGKESLRGLERKHGPLPETMESITGGGGRHVYFSHPGGVVHNRTNIEPGIDLRGDGGCIVAPPTSVRQALPLEKGSRSRGSKARTTSRLVALNIVFALYTKSHEPGKNPPRGGFPGIYFKFRE
jgi:hypothetical protein